MLALDGRQINIWWGKHYKRLQTLPHDHWEAAESGLHFYLASNCCNRRSSGHESELQALTGVCSVRALRGDGVRLYGRPAVPGAAANAPASGTGGAGCAGRSRASCAADARGALSGADAATVWAAVHAAAGRWIRTQRQGVSTTLCWARRAAGTDDAAAGQVVAGTAQHLAAPDQRSKPRYAVSAALTGGNS
ncbi:MAG: hypothetical protein H6R01_1962 [Burkholderiaceae bacterium]|nr:hypothetical protein [Burkholderiaceae bacterium]